MTFLGDDKDACLKAVAEINAFFDQLAIKFNFVIPDYARWRVNDQDFLSGKLTGLSRPHGIVFTTDGGGVDFRDFMQSFMKELSVETLHLFSSVRIKTKTNDKQNAFQICEAHIVNSEVLRRIPEICDKYTKKMEKLNPKNAFDTQCLQATSKLVVPEKKPTKIVDIDLGVNMRFLAKEVSLAKYSDKAEGFTGRKTHEHVNRLREALRHIDDNTKDEVVLLKAYEEVKIIAQYIDLKRTDWTSEIQDLNQSVKQIVNNIKLDSKNTGEFKKPYNK